MRSRGINFRESTIVGAILHFFTIRIILYGAKRAKRDNRRLPSTSKTIIKARRIKASGLFENFAFEFVRLQIFINLALDDHLSILSNIHDLLLIVLTSYRKIIDLNLKLSFYGLKSTQVPFEPCSIPT